VTVADTAGFKVGAFAVISQAGGVNSQQVVVEYVQSPTVMFVGPIVTAQTVPYVKPRSIANRLDVSAYTVASGSYVEQYSQPKDILSPDDREIATYDGEPTDAWRTIFVDEYGRYYNTANPLPATFSGSITIGEVSSQTQDGFGNPINSTTQAGVRGLDVEELGYSSANAPARNDYTVTPVTTGAWVQLVASMSHTAQEIEIFDSSGQTLALGFGASGSEVAQINILPGGNGRVKLVVPSATRVSIKAISANASVGEIDINFYG
jgi:hypothetical protein